MAGHYIAFNSEIHNKLFGKSFDFVPNNFWADMVARAIGDVTGDAVFSCQANGANFNISTMRGKKLTAYVRFSQERRTVCLGVEKGGKHGYTDEVLKSVVGRACADLTATPNKDALPPAPTRPTPGLQARAYFCGEEYGSDYLNFKQGDINLPLCPISGVDTEDWSYSCAT